MSCLLPFLKEKHPGPTAPPVPISTSSDSGKDENRPVTMITSVFCGWANPNPYIDAAGVRALPGTQAPNREPWDALRTRDRIPAIGEYDERDPAVTKLRLLQMERAKIDVACYQVDWSHQHAVNPPDYLIPIDNPLLMSWCAENHPETSPIQFCLSFWDVMTGPEGMEYFTGQRRDRGWSDIELEQSMRLFARAVAPYMKRPNYWRINGRPVLYRGWAHTLDFYSKQFGFSLTPRQITDFWREEIKSIIGVEPYLVATASPAELQPNLKAWGFDCLTQYLLHGKGWADTMEVYRGWWSRDLAMCRQQKLDYIVPVTSGYKGEAWNTGEWQSGFTHVCTATQFRDHITEARKLAHDNSGIVKGVGSYAWDENGEGGIMEPMKPGMLHDGDELVRAHAEACI